MHSFRRRPGEGAGGAQGRIQDFRQGGSAFGRFYERGGGGGGGGGAVRLLLTAAQFCAVIIASDTQNTLMNI